MKTKSAVLVAIPAILLLTAAAHADGIPATYTLNQLKSDNIKKVQRERSSSLTGNNMKLEAMREIALSVGASAGMAFEYDQIYSGMLTRRTNELDKEFDFEKLKLSAGVLPPVISQSFSPYEMKDSNLVRIGSNNFKIEKPARMVSAYPTWRDYLKPKLPSFDLPLSNYLPKNRKEKQVWDAAVQEGYRAGQRQAREAWRHSLGELQRDYTGMLLFRTLLLQGKITPTVLANNHLGTVVSEDGSAMSLDVNEIGIVSHSRFDKHSADKNGAKQPSVYMNSRGKRF